VAGSQEKQLTMEGQLTATDPLDRLRKQSHHKVHEVALEKNRAYLIELRSSLSTPTCAWRMSTGRQLAENNNISADNLNLPSGIRPERDGQVPFGRYPPSREGRRANTP